MTCAGSPSDATMRRPPLFAIGVISATALGYEILLMRLFSIIQWHHFAYMIISVALLGYGASGTFLAFTQTRLLANYRPALVINAALFGLTAIVNFLLAQRVPFNPEEILWDWREPLRLMAVCLLLSLPFFFAANAIALTLAGFRSAITRIYAVDLLGAGAGSLGILYLLFAFAPMDALILVSALALACAAIAAIELRAAGRYPVAGAILVAACALVWLTHGAVPVASPYKDLSQTLRVNGARIVAERHSPLGLINVVENPEIPLRYAPGMSLNSTLGPPAQLGVFSDGNSAGAITRDNGDPSTLRYLDQLGSALPYHLKKLRRVLVLGAGGGADVLQARARHVEAIHAVELNPQIIELVRDDFSDFSGGLYRQPGVYVHAADARGFLAGRDVRYDLIQHGLQNSFGPAPGGLYALTESYLYTIEAMQTYLDHLEPGGYLALNQWIALPPRNTLKLFATAVAALRRAGIAQPGRRLVLVRNWQTSTLLIKNGEFTPREIDAMRRFCRTRAFDVAWYPGISATEPNRHHILREPYFYLAARALLGRDDRSFIDRYKFDLRPATDNRPYFHDFFKWSTLPEILSLRGQGGMPLLEAAYPVLFATLCQGILASALLIALPLIFVKRADGVGQARVSARSVVAYFTAIGVAFFFVEIAFIQKFMLFLHHPLLTVAVVLASFLVFAGVGSTLARRHTLRQRYRGGVTVAGAGIVVFGAAYLLGLDALFESLGAWSAAAKISMSIALIAPLAFFMGMPFPLALASLGNTSASMIPLAWGVNGCASVVSAILATILAMHFGFTIVIGLALLLYVAALIVFPTEK